MFDNMPFQSQEFLTFSHAWGFKTTTSSPNYPQSNGLVERTIQTIKSIFKNADYEIKDPYLLLLEFRNTPVCGLPYSPAQIFMSKRLHSKLPCARKLLEPCVVDITDPLSSVQSRQQYYYNRGTKPLSPLKKGEKVYRKQRNRRDQAVIVDRDVNPRSYVVQSEHGLVRRNRRHLFKANPTANFDSNTQCVDDADHYTNVACNNSRNFVRATTPHFRTSCFGRRITQPRKFDDYV